MKNRPSNFKRITNIQLKNIGRRLSLLLFSLSCHYCIQAQQPKPKWVNDFHGNSSASRTTSIAIDKQNNIYITGWFYGTVDFDPSSGIKNLTSAGLTDVFIGKYKQDGSLIWVESIGGDGGDTPYNITVDNDGNVSIVGSYFSLTVDADPGPGVYNLKGKNTTNGFLIHLDTNGNFLWAHSLEGDPTNNDQGNYYTVVSDSLDDVIATAQVPANVTIGDSTHVQPTSQVIKYDPSGSVLWSLNLHDPTAKPVAHSTPMGIAVDSQNNLLVSGIFTTGTINFNPSGNASNITTPDLFSYFLAKYNSAGNLIWVNPIYSPKANSEAVQTVLSVDRRDDIDFATTFYPSIILGSTTLNYTGNGLNECIAKYSPAGNLLFAKTLGGPTNIGYSGVGIQNGIANDNDNNIYLSGYLFGSVNLDPDLGAAGSITAHGQQDFYLAKYDSVGNYIYAFSAGSNNCGNTYGNDAVVDMNNNIDIVGSFCSTVNFDATGCSTINMTATSVADPFIAQYATELSITNNKIDPPIVNSFCTNGSPASIIGNLPTGGDGTYTYQWESSVDSVNFASITGATDQNFTSPTITQTTFYTRIVNSGGCPSPPPALSSNVVKLTILPTLAIPVVTVAGTTSSSIIFNWSSIPGATGYQVSTNGGLTYLPVAGLADTLTNLKPGQSVTLIVKAIGSIVCQTSAASVEVSGTVPESDLVYVANAFTPNGDGRNDVLHVLGANIQSLKFYIYDQWGEQIFTSTNSQNGWDGTYKGTKESVGVYVYYLEAVMADGQIVKKKGTVTLLK